MAEKEYIEREAVIESFDEPSVERNYGDVGMDSVIRVIERIPPADVRLVVRGKWKRIGQFGVVVVCSVCGKSPDRKTNFCPNCGADMREESG